MSGEGEDPLGFAPDDRDRQEAARSPQRGPGGREPGTQDAAGDDPLGFAPDERDRTEPAERAGGAATERDPEEQPLAFVPDERDRSAPAADSDDGSAAGRSGARRGGPTLASKGAPRANRYMAIGALLLFGVVTISLLTSGGSGTGSIIGPGDRLPPFAAPIATAPKLDHDDVNLATAPDQGEAGSKPACSIRHSSVVTSCALLERGPLVLVLYTGGVGECVRAVDALDRLRGRGAQVLAVSVLGEHDDTARTVRERRWRIPVAYDHDGGLSTKLGVPACPFVLLVDRRGVIRDRIVGGIAPGRLERAVDRLVRRDAPPSTSTRRG